MLFAYRNKNDGQVKIYVGYRAQVDAFAVAGTVKELPRLPVDGEEVLDQTTMEIVADPDKAAREKLAALSATDTGVIRGVDDLWALLVSKGVIRAEDVPPLLKAKLDARAALRADLEAAPAQK